MHLVHHQFGLLRPHTEHELIWRKCLFEFGKSVFYSYSHLSRERERERQRKKNNSDNFSHALKPKHLIYEHLLKDISKLICISVLLLFVACVFEMFLCKMKFIHILFGWRASISYGTLPTVAQTEKYFLQLFAYCLFFSLSLSHENTWKLDRTIEVNSLDV